MNHSRYFLEFFISAVLLISVWSRPAYACSCASGAWLVWPEPGAISVSRDTPLVVRQMPAAFEVVLIASDNSEVQLSTARVLPNKPHMCGGDLVFLRPTTTLLENRTYTVEFRPANKALVSDSAAVSFTTGTEIAGDITPTGLSLQYRRVLQPSTCVEQKEPPVKSCNDYAVFELVDDNPSALLPSWLYVTAKSSFGVGEVVRWLNLTDPTGSVQQLAIKRDEPCINYEWIDIYGQSIEKRTLCTPNLCAMLGENVVLSTGSTCYLFTYGTSGDFGLDGSLWNQVPANSCETLPILSRSPFGGLTVVTRLDNSNTIPQDGLIEEDAAVDDSLTYARVEEDAAVGDSSSDTGAPPFITTSRSNNDTITRRNSSGCNVAAASHFGTIDFGWYILLAILVMSRRARRQ
jgi:hypothetical protein